VSDSDSRHNGNLLRDTGHYGLEHILRAGLAAVTGVLVARYLGPSGLGLLNYIQALFSILIPLVFLGLPGILVRDFSTGEDWRPTLSTALAVQIIAAAVVSAVAFALVLLTRGTEDETILIAAALAPLPFLAVHETLRKLLEARGQSRRILLAGIIAALLSSAIKIYGVATTGPVWIFAAAWTAESLTLAFALAIAIPGWSRLTRIRHWVRLDMARRLTQESWPLLVSSVAAMLFMRLDLIMLGLLTGDAETGVYAAAVRLSEVWYFLPVAATAALRPLLSRLWATGDTAQYQRQVLRMMSLLSAAAYATILVTMVSSDFIISLLYGVDFAASASVLRWHVLAVPFVFLSAAADPWFIDRSLTRLVMLRSLAGAGINLVLNLLLIPRQGATGAAIATVVSYAFVGVFLNGLSRTARPLLTLQLQGLILGGGRSHWRRG
jgi:polysaccharide transporter, PST family